MTDDSDVITAKRGEARKIFVYKDTAIEVNRCSDNQWRDKDGTVYAIFDRALETDTDIRCGVGIFSLPEHWAINTGCAPHDFAYSSETYEVTHPRSAADAMLRRDVYLVEKSRFGSLEALLVSDTFWVIVRALGWVAWDKPANVAD